MTTRRLMAVAAVAGVALSWVAHAIRLLKEDVDFGPSILAVEVIFGLFVVLPVLLAIGLVSRMSRNEAAYIAELKRKEIPVVCPWHPINPDTPKPIVASSDDQT